MDDTEEVKFALADRAIEGSDGRVDLYAGFCDPLSRAGGHPSRPAVADRL
jgi:hypothetical protein